MKRLKSSFLLAFLLSLPTYGQWQVLNEGETLWWPGKIVFINDELGYSSNYRNIIKTTDFGNTWSVIEIDGYEWGSINEYDFFDEQKGWVLVNDYSVEEDWLFFTEDGGKSWQLKSVFPDNNYLNDVEFIDENIVYATMRENEVIKTTDAGESWIDATPPGDYERFSSINFANHETGFIVADLQGTVFLRTSDGGENWEERQTNLIDVWKTVIKNDSTIFFTAWDGSNRIFCETRDTFNSWTVKSKLEEIETFGFSSEDTVHAIVNGYFAISSDTGSTWKVIQKANEWGYGDFYFNNNGEGLLNCVAPLEYYNSGRIDFRFDKKNSKWELTYLTYAFKTAHFFNENIGFAGGGESVPHWSVGDIFMTTDGGKTWELNFSPENPVESFSFIDENTGFALTSSYRGSWIYKTTSGGHYWFPAHDNFYESYGFEFSGMDMKFINESTGWAVGHSQHENSEGAAIIVTHDSGENWDLVWKHLKPEGYNYKFNSIHATDFDLWAVGENGLIVSSSGFGSYERHTGITDLPLNDVYFSDANHGWIAGGIFDHDKYHFLLRTSNGGESWEKIKDLEFHINAVYFQDNLHGWAAGTGMWDTGGLIMETYDGGLSWIPQVENLSAALSSLHFKDGYGWAVGNNGLILRTDGTSWVDEKTGKTYPNAFSLSQNYPNPFNPTTTIKYSIPSIVNSELSKVKLIIYDLLGSEIAVLVNEKQKPGEYETIFHAEDLSSGVYFYKLEAGSFANTKKLVLLK